MTLLSIAVSIADEIGVIAPTKLIGASDLTAKRFLASANAAGQSLYRLHPWSVLHRESVFTTVIGVDNYAVPDDWGRPQLPLVAWDRDQLRRARGNTTAGQWQGLKSSLLGNSGLVATFRLFSGPLSASILLDPVPTAATTLVIEYVSRFWLQDASGNGKIEPTVDTDDVRIDHEVFRLEMLWRTRRSLGLAHQDDRIDAISAARNAVVSDMALPVMAAVPPFDEDADRQHVGEGSFPGPT